MSNAEHLSASDPSETPKTRSRKTRTAMEQHPSRGLSESEIAALGSYGLTRIMRTRLLTRRTPFSTGSKYSDWTQMIIHERRIMKSSRQQDEAPEDSVDQTGN